MRLLEIEHYRTQGRKKAKKFKDTYELSMAISREYECYSDRWNPAKWAYVREMERILKIKMMKEYGYKPEEWVIE